MSIQHGNENKWGVIKPTLNAWFVFVWFGALISLLHCHLRTITAVLRLSFLPLCYFWKVSVNNNRLLKPLNCTFSSTP